MIPMLGFLSQGGSLFMWHPVDPPPPLHVGIRIVSPYTALQPRMAWYTPASPASRLTDWLKALLSTSNSF